MNQFKNLFLEGASEPLSSLTILFIVLGIIIVIFAVICISNIKIVPQTQAYVVERLGKFYKVWGTGVHWLVPFIDHVAVDAAAPSYQISKLDGIRKIGIVNLKEQVIDFDPQPVITQDNVTMQIDTVIYFQVTDAKAYVYGVSNPIRALDNLTTTTIRNIMGGLELDKALTSREAVNDKMREILDEATDPWGIRVKRVEIKNIMPPKDIRDAMEKQMRAEREKRAAILKAQGEKESAILIATGEKESAILKAEARKETSIREAEGQAEAILSINKAEAEALAMLKQVQVDEKVLTLKSYDAMAKVANGQATKIIVPSSLQNLTGVAMSLKEVLSPDQKTPVENKSLEKK
jgi:regulator of protease activity HflC (stomatin/prohibitin superfamily)